MLRSVLKTVVNYGSGVVATALLAGAGLAFGGPDDTTAPASDSGTVAEKSGVSPEVLGRAQEKVLRAQAIVNQFASRATLEGFTTDQWRYELMSNLLQGGTDGFVKAARAGTLLEALKAAQDSMSTTRGGVHGITKAFGSATGDLIFFPSPPCRIVDTRTVGGAFASSETRTYSFTGGVSQVNPSTCNPYLSYPGAPFPAAMAINVGAIAFGLGGSPSVSGFVSVYPQGGSATTSFMNFWGNDIISNAGVVPLNQTNGQFTVLAQFPTHITVDYFGSFVESPATALDCVQTALTTQSVLNGGIINFDANACPSGFTAVSLTCHATNAFGGTDWTGSGLKTTGTNDCQGVNNSGITQIYNAATTCCRIAGR
jgi:hypothetical protein